MPNYKQCKATSKRTKKRCRAPAVKGRDVCYHHGGASPRGIASKSFKTGARSKYIPKNLMTAYQEAYDDPDRMSTRADIALYEARIAEMLKELDGANSSDIWQELDSVWQDFMIASQGGNRRRARELAARIDDIIKRGASIWQAWNQIDKFTDQKRRLIESELKRAIAAKQYYTYDEVSLFMAAILRVLRDNVDDRKILESINDGISHIIGA